MLKSVNVRDIIKNAKGNVIPEFLKKENPEAKVMPAFIDLSVTCMRCGCVLYSGCYTKGIIGKLKKKIKKAKSPSIRLFLTTKEKNDNKKRKSVLYPEQNGSLLMKSMNFTNRKNNLRNKHKPNNAVTLSQNFDSIMRNYLK